MFGVIKLMDDEPDINSGDDSSIDDSNDEYEDENEDENEDEYEDEYEENESDIRKPRGINWEHLLAEGFLFVLLFIIVLWLIRYEIIITTDVNGNVVSISRPRWNF